MGGGGVKNVSTINCVTSYIDHTQFRLGLAAQWHILELLYIPIDAKFKNLPNFLEVLKFRDGKILIKF